MEAAAAGATAATVTAATGALGPVLAKLTTLLRHEFKLQQGSRSAIEFIKSELEPVHSLLLRIWERDDVEDACKSWMTAVRGQSYAMEDTIDDLMVDLKKHGDGGFTKGTKANPFRDLKTQVQKLIKQCDDKWKKTPETSSNRSKPIMDARSRFLHKDASELVGLDEPKKMLIEELQNNEMVCIVGPAGTGKTTLADLVYNEVGEGFQCRAFVSLSPSPDMTEVLKSILTQVTKGVQSAGAEAATEQHLVDNIYNFLADKRYLVVIDDIWDWDKWEIIRGALPNNHPSNKIIATTRVNALALRFEEVAVMHRHWGYRYRYGSRDAWILSKVILEKSGASDKLDGTDLEEVCQGIVGMCRGMALGIICLSKALAESVEKGNYKGWYTWKRHVVDGFQSIPSLKPLVESLCRGYDDLPIHVKTCLLYCAMYDEGTMVPRLSLVRQWIAEGFVYQEEAAEACLEELVSRNLLETAGGSNNMVQVHPVMLAFFVCKSREANLVTREPSSSTPVKSIQRLSDYSSDYYLEDILVYHTRSVYIRGYIMPHWKQLERLRVLQCQNNRFLRDDDLVAICGLLHLRYLGLRSCRIISRLPSQIRRLQNLETLDVMGTEVTEIPWEAAQLPNLVRVLHGDEVYPRVVRLPEDLCQAFKNRSTDLSSQAKCRSFILLEDHFGLRWMPLPVNLAIRHVHVPQWIGASLGDVVSLDIMLCKLEEGDQKLLGELPNLKCLVVRFQLLPRKAIPIMGGGFEKLENFCFDCRLPHVAFQPGAMPNLKYLQFKFYSGPASHDPVGITCLRSIEKVVFKCSKNYSSQAPGISATINVVRREAAEHPNKIALIINVKYPEVFPAKSDIAGISYQGNSILQGSSGGSSASVVETSLAGDCNLDNDKGKALQVTSHTSCSRASEIHEIEEAQE